MSPKTRHAISQVVPFGVIWFVTSIVYTMLERGILGKLDHYPSTGNPYNFLNNLVLTPVSSIIVGLAMGTFEVFYLNRFFIKRSFISKMLVKAFIYFTAIVVFLLALSVIGNMTQMHLGLSDRVIWSNAWLFLSSFSFWGVGIYIVYGIVVSLFYAEVSGNIGSGVLNNFFSGKYHTPTQEERIFMFLDMKSSTTIAEQIGHVRYFEMLKEYFSDLNDSIIAYEGEIYQYVGDEIVISWRCADGIRSNNCIECFFAMKRKMESVRAKYVGKFGLLPAFKAGFHLGSVTTGEIGVTKKEIVFTGDVLNTAARIQSLCNSFNTDILISGQVIELLPNATNAKMLAETELRGRGEKVRLYTIEK